MFNVFSLEEGHSVQLMTSEIDPEEGTMYQFCSQGLPDTNDILKPLKIIYNDIC